MGKNTQVRTEVLEHLFDAELEYRPDKEPVVSSEGREGEFVGSQDGRVRGDKVAGTLRWSVYEVVGQDVCDTNPGGVIETEDGARIDFDGRGHALRVGAPDSKLWRHAMSVLFQTDDQRYAWLNGTLGVWEGLVDLGTGSGRYRVYVPAGG